VTEPCTAASARPERLTRLAETTGAIVEAVSRRAGWLDDAWGAYAAGNEAGWRFDFSAMGGAVRAWAQTLGAIGSWTGLVGEAFVDAGGRASGGVRTVGETRVLDLLPCDARAVVDDAELAHEVDWGDADAPPAWVEDLRLTSVGLDHVGDGVDAVEVAFVVGSGADARWSPATPAVLGRFATASATARFARLFSVGTVGVGGFAAGVEQWFSDADPYSLTEGERRARAATRGVAVGGAALGGSLLGTGVAGLVCTTGAPVCAGAVIIATGVAVSGVSDGLLDRLLGSPEPAEHDPDRVEDEIAGLDPGYLPRDVSDAEWEVLEAIDHAGETAGERDHERRHAEILTGELTADVAAAHDLPPSWVEERDG